MDTKELESEVKAKAVSEIVTHLTNDSYHSQQLKTYIDKEIANRVADIYMRDHELKLLQSIDTDSVIKLATLGLIERIMKRLNQ